MLLSNIIKSPSTFNYRWTKRFTQKKKRRRIRCAKQDVTILDVIFKIIPQG
jgi:hypothetical protein